MRENRVLSVQSHVVHGYVGNRAAAVVFNLHGMESDQIQTCQLTCHTGYSSFKGAVLDKAALETLKEGMRDQGFFPEYSHILTGYIGNAEFLREVGSLLDLAPQAAFVCDPVLGDEGHLYVPEELVAIYRDEIIPRATVITPNQFELELLYGKPVTSVSDVKAAMEHFHSRGPRIVVVTSSNLGGPHLIQGFASIKTQNGQYEQYEFSVPKLPYRFVGTGDVFSAGLLVNLAKSDGDIAKSLSNVLSGLQAILQDTVRHALGSGNC